MALSEITQPRGLVLKFEDDGTISGRCCFVTRILRDGEVLSTVDGDEMALADAAAAGFPIADALAALTAALPA